MTRIALLLLFGTRDTLSIVAAFVAFGLVFAACEPVPSATGVWIAPGEVKCFTGEGREVPCKPVAAGVEVET